MATPTDPTLDSLATEAYRKTFNTTYSPSTAELTRAKSEFLQEIFNDVWNRSVLTGNTRLKTLETYLVTPSVKGTRTVALAEDFDEEFSVSILDGTVRGTAQAGASTSITLALTETTLTATTALGQYIFITGGTGSGQIRQITGYNATTKVATVDSAWTVNPALDSTYLVVGSVYELDEDNEMEFDYYLPAAAGKPSFYAKYGRQIIFDKPFDVSTYGLLIRYYQNLNQVDLVEGASALITRILRNWRQMLAAGLRWKILQSQNDNQEAGAKQEYEQAVQSVLIKEIPYGGEWVGFTV